MKDIIEPIPLDADQRACVQQWDADGVLIVRTYGPSPSELQAAHDRGECGKLVGPWCGICYHEAMVSIGLE